MPPRSGFVQLLLAPDGLVFCWIRAQRQPWLRNHYTAGAGCGNMIRARESDRAAGEATAVRRQAMLMLWHIPESRFLAP